MQDSEKQKLIYLMETKVAKQQKRFKVYTNKSQGTVFPHNLI